MITFSSLGISIKEMQLGKQTAICPNCSHKRKKEHQNLKCLTATNEIGNRWFNCNHCGYSGNLEVMEKVHKLNNKHKVPKEAPKAYSPLVLEFLKNKRLSIQTAQKLMWYEVRAGVLAFPYMYGYYAVKVSFRDLAEEKKTGKKKVWQSSNEDGSINVFYGVDSLNPYVDLKVQKLPNIDKPCVVVMITEGQTDRATWYECGFDQNTYIISVPSGSPPKNAKDLEAYFAYLNDSKFKNFLETVSKTEIVQGESKYIPDVKFFLAHDNDEVGRNLMNELAGRLGKHRCWIPEYPDGIKDASDVLKQKGVKGVEALYKSFKPFPISGVVYVKDVRAAINDRINRGVQKGLLTGHVGIDKHVSWHPNLLWVWTGVSGAGKSTVLRHYLMRLVKQNVGVKPIKTSLFTPEMTPPEREFLKLMELYAEMPASAHERYTGSTFRTNIVAKNEALDFVQDYFNIITPTEMQYEAKFMKSGDSVNSLDTILRYFEHQVKEYGVKQFVIDAWNKLEHDLGKMSETTYVSKALDKILNFNNNYGAVTHIVAHPTKTDQIGGKFNNPNFKKPTLYGINGSANFKNKCMVGIVIDRKKFMPTEEKTEDNEVKWLLNKDATTDVYFEKVKFDEIGEEGMIRLRRNWKRGEFFEDVDETSLEIPNFQVETPKVEIQTDNSLMFMPRNDNDFEDDNDTDVEGWNID